MMGLLKKTFLTVHKVGAKHTKLKQYISALCDLSVIPIAIGDLATFAVNGFPLFQQLHSKQSSSLD